MDRTSVTRREFCADQRLAPLGPTRRYQRQNPWRPGILPRTGSDELFSSGAFLPAGLVSAEVDSSCAAFRERVFFGFLASTPPSMGGCPP